MYVVQRWTSNGRMRQAWRRPERQPTAHLV